MNHFIFCVQGGTYGPQQSHQQMFIYQYKIRLFGALRWDTREDVELRVPSEVSPRSLPDIHDGMLHGPEFGIGCARQEIRGLRTDPLVAITITSENSRTSAENTSRC